MIVADPGHYYFLDTLDGGKAQVLTFVKREGDKYPGNVGHYPGVNVQEVLRACIDRMIYLNNQIYDSKNDAVISNLRDCIWLLESRAAARHGRPWPIDGFDAVTTETCKKCGHVGCTGGCHVSS